LVRGILRACPASLISASTGWLSTGAGASLCLGFAVYASSGAKLKLYAVLVAAALLPRERLPVTAAYALHLLGLRRFRRSLLFTTAILPAAAWTPMSSCGFRAARRSSFDTLFR